MFYNDGFLHAIVDTGFLATNENETKSNPECEGESSESEPKNILREASLLHTKNDETDISAPNIDLDSGKNNEIKEKTLSNKQQQKAKRKLKKQQAKDQLKKRHCRLGNNSNNVESTLSSPQKDNANGKSATSATTAPPLRLHQFVSTVFRSELNVAENGAGYFVKNAPKVSAHHAILQGVVHLNGNVCKLGRTVLKYGDDVSLQLESEIDRNDGDLIAWRGSVEVAERLEGSDRGERQGRMMASSSSSNYVQGSIQKETMSDCEMIKYYRERLGRVWVPEVHESAIMRPLPLTLRVLKPSARLDDELRELGFGLVTEENDFSLQLSCLGKDDETKRLSSSAMQELLRDTWIARGNNNNTNNNPKEDDSTEKKLGLFLSEARVTGEMMQQELTSMIPVAILAAHLKQNRTLFTKKNADDLRFLDLCAAPGSKTCQLLSALDKITSTKNNNDNSHQSIDYTLVANELSPQRANWMRQRLHQQSCSKSLSNLIVTCADGRDYAKMDQNCFDYVLCDVPCSGDGTVRKSPKIVGKWSPKNGAKNKIIQKELLTVGLGLLKPSDRGEGGGFLVYSTCSLNPLENEQVISEVMNELNGKEGSAFRYELVDLSDEPSKTNNGGADNDLRNTFLRVLPAKSHGGFFVAGIRKLAVLATDDNRVVEPRTETGDVTIDSSKRGLLVRRNVGTANGSSTTMSYSISPCTQRCCARLIEKLGRSTVVSSGVPVLYETNNDDGHIILQQGCASLASSRQQEHVVAYIQLSPAEMTEGHANRPAHREVLLPMDRVHTNISLGEGLPLIIEVGVPSSGDGQSVLLPARIVRLLKDDDGDASAASAKEVVVAKILARPQIFERAIFRS
mmetsp:Transcript_19001/g.35427  ORF Transcript_19001/g.35427 Transcript_19001/m.35427 type:complete len:853 (+) Transcript_19001:42-2600(+)